MKKLLCTAILLSHLCICIAQNTPHGAVNLSLELGTDGYFGLMGMSSLRKADNPLVSNDLKNKYAFSGAIALELLSLHKRNEGTWGRIAPDLGIKAKAEWMYIYADNSLNGGSESLGLNFINIPVFLEACLAYKSGVTRAYREPGKDVITGGRDVYGTYRFEHQYEAGTYHRGGQPTSAGIFIYGGPQLCYLMQPYHNKQPFTDPNLQTTTYAFVGGLTIWMSAISIDLSYQEGLTSVYKDKEIMMNGFSAKLGLWLACTKRRVY